MRWVVVLRLILGGALLAPPSALWAQVWRVAPGTELSTVTEALESAAPGDTVVVGPGVYRERLVVSRPVVLLGEEWPVIDGEGQGHVIEATAPIEIRGFIVRGSGTSVDLEHSGLMVRGGRSQVVGNWFEDVLYGIYLKEAPGSVVARNRVIGKPFPKGRRGDGIRLWYSAGSRVDGNEVERTRDLVVYFSDSLTMRGNRVQGGRYGIHYMYSNHSRLEDNELVDNNVGAFLMYSEGIRLSGNVFARSRGETGFGMGLKDADEIRADGNVFVDNRVGVQLDNSPRSRDATNRFVDNAFLHNGVGIRLLPSVRGNGFAENGFLGNERPVEVAGGVRPGQERQNEWDGNYWDEYAGFDRDLDGVGDTPYVYARLADVLMSRHPDLRLFARSPAFAVLDLVTGFFPLLRPEPVFTDSIPRLELASLDQWQGRVEGLDRDGERPLDSRLKHGVVWVLVAVGAVGVLRVGTRGKGVGG
jgi:nitrous oxidase accessory protein